MHYLFLCVWLLSFKIMFVKFILTCRCQSFILTAMYLLFVLMYHNPVYCQRAVGCFLVFGCINSPVNILHVYIYFWCFACLMGMYFRIVWQNHFVNFLKIDKKHMNIPGAPHPHLRLAFLVI